MRTIATDVCMCVCMLVKWVCAEMAEPIKIPVRVGPGNHVLDGLQIPTEGVTFEGAYAGA